MGVHVPGLAVGVSLGEHFMLKLSKCNIVLLGLCTSRWKNIQASGRLGRDPSQRAIYITLAEARSSVRCQVFLPKKVPVFRLNIHKNDFFACMLLKIGSLIPIVTEFSNIPFWTL